MSQNINKKQTKEERAAFLASLGTSNFTKADWARINADRIKDMQNPDIGGCITPRPDKPTLDISSSGIPSIQGMSSSILTEAEEKLLNERKFPPKTR